MYAIRSYYAESKGDRLDPHLPENQIEFLRKLRKNNVRYLDTEC